VAARQARPGNGSTLEVHVPALRFGRRNRVIAAACRFAAARLAELAVRGTMRPAHRKPSIWSPAMEFTAIVVFTAIVLWFVTEVGGESL